MKRLLTSALSLFTAIVVTCIVCAPPAHADVLCKRRHGTVAVRDTCRQNEALLDPVALGLQGPTGLQGEPGIDGAPGPQGEPGVCDRSCSFPPVLLTDDFNDGNADGWWLGYSQHTPWVNGNWRVEDLGSPHGGVLVQDNGGDHFIALVENLQLAAQTIETKVRLNDFGSYGGVTVWFQDDDNWVDILLYPAAGFIRVLEIVNGAGDADGSPDYLYSYPSSQTTWYTMKVVANSVAGTLDVYIDNTFVFTHNVVTSNRQGSSGVNNGNAGAYFDDFIVTGVQPESCQ